MSTIRIAVTGLTLVAGALLSAAASADVIHLTNGSTIQVDAWRDAGDAVEFASGGGIIRIPKTEIRRIEGQPSPDLRMRSAPASPARREATGDKEVAGTLLDLVKQGEALFGQTVLSAAEKAGAFRRLGEKWRETTPPDVLQEAHARGQRALQIAAEAYTQESEGTAPDTKERIESAKAALKEAQEELKKATGEQG